MLWTKCFNVDMGCFNGNRNTYSDHVQRCRTAKICLMEASTRNVVGTAEVSHVETVDSFSRLRSCQPFDIAESQQKRAWKSRT